jgi:hypothetical protein
MKMKSLSMSEKTAAKSPVLERPFYFIVVLWGERFRNYFLNYCVPSLLSPGNLPALSTQRPSRFLIATRPEDWASMKEAESFKAMERYVNPTYLEIPPHPPGDPGVHRMSIGHKLACHLAFADKAYGVVLTPDSMLSDGSVARMQELARSGFQLVLAAALRFAEEPFLERIDSLRSTHRGNGNALVISSRQMVGAAVHSFHRETLSYEWQAPYFVSSPTPIPAIPAAWWQVPGEDGIVLHCMSWAALALDYGALEEHDTSTLDTWTIDGDYLHKNQKGIERIHIVTDSDEIFIASWTPSGDRPGYRRIDIPLFRFVLKGIFGRQFAASYYGPDFDDFRRRLFWQVTRWHSQPVNENWYRVEACAASELGQFINNPRNAAAARSRAPSYIAWVIWLAIRKVVVFSFRITLTLADWFDHRNRIAQHLRMLLHGDANARKMALQKMRQQLGRVIGLKRKG